MALARGQYCGMYSSSAPTDWTSACSSFSCWSGLLAVGEADLAHDFQVDDFQSNSVSPQWIPVESCRTRTALRGASPALSPVQTS